MALNVASGTYTGNGSSLSVTGLGFKPKAVFISSRASGPAQSGMMSFDSMPSGNSVMVGDNNPVFTSILTSFDSGGFTVGSNSMVNTNTDLFDWFALGGDAASIATGTYTGNGSSQAVSGLSFQPAIVIVSCNGASDTRPVLSTVSGTGIWLGTNASSISSSITALNASGFSVGSASQVNGSGLACWWLAIPAITGFSWGGSYTGNGSTQNITTPGFQPDVVAIKNSAAIRGAWRGSGAMTGDQTDEWIVGTLPLSGLVTSFVSTGFALGSNSIVNTSSTTYYAFALKNQVAAPPPSGFWFKATR